MNRLKTFLLTATCLVIAGAVPARADPVTYSGYSVLNNQTVTLNASYLGGGVDEISGSGQITLTGTNTPGGIIATWCVDIRHALQGSGQFTPVLIDNAVGDRINALITHAAPDLSANYDASSALQIAIWRTEYSQTVTVSAAADASSLANSYLAKLADGTWTADPTMRVVVLSGEGSNQDQAYLTAVPEPASLAVVATGLIGLGLIRRQRA